MGTICFEEGMCMSRQAYGGNHRQVPGIMETYVDMGGPGLIGLASSSTTRSEQAEVRDRKWV